MTISNVSNVYLGEHVMSQALELNIFSTFATCHDQLLLEALGCLKSVSESAVLLVWFSLGKSIMGS